MKFSVILNWENTLYYCLWSPHFQNLHTNTLHSVPDAFCSKKLHTHIHTHTQFFLCEKEAIYSHLQSTKLTSASTTELKCHLIQAFTWRFITELSHFVSQIWWYSVLRAYSIYTALPLVNFKHTAHRHIDYDKKKLLKIMLTWWEEAKQVKFMTAQ